MTVIADTLRAKKRLVEAGFTDEKAEGIISIFNEADAQIATKLDLELFRKDINSSIEEVKRDIAELRKETKTGIEELRKETKTDIEMLRRDLTHLILKAQFAGVIATVGILSAIRFFL